MNRALRRHPVVTKTPKRVRTSAAGPRPPRPTQRLLPRWRRMLQPRWAEEIVSELRKVVWPPRNETTYLGMVVIIVSIVVGLVLGSLDIVLSWIADRTILR